MKIIRSKNIKLIADEGMIIQSKATHFDEELQGQVPDIEGPVVYLGKNDKPENYIEVEVEDGCSEI